MEKRESSPELEAYVTLPFDPDTPPLDILGTLWDKFYAWEYHASASILEGLKCDLALEDAFGDDLDDSDDDDDDYDGYRSATTLSSRSANSSGIMFDTEHLEYLDYEGEEEEVFIMTAKVQNEPAERRQSREWKPNPRYTTCTPINSNIFNVSNENDLAIAPYAFFADDPSFDLDKFLGLHDRFAWQCDFGDPDHEMVKLETVRVLHFQQGLSLDEIDNLDLPTFQKMRIHSAAGLIWEACQRDYLPWPDSLLSPLPQVTLSDVVAYFSMTEHDIFSQVQYASTMFCPNFGCLSSSGSTCQIHNVPAIQELQPTIKSEDFPARVPCGDSCYRHAQDDLDGEALESLEWVEGSDDWEQLKGILKLSPDGDPCDLAVICRKPCVQVFVNRRKLFPDDDILDEQPTDRVQLPHFYDDTAKHIPDPDNPNESVTSMWIPISPCSHPGPCTKNVCSCVDNNFHCERNCRCNHQCSNRWKGCKCRHSKKKKSKSKNNPKVPLCLDYDVCPCRESYRECDPELCLGCDCKNTGKKDRRKCGNSAVQNGLFPRIRVARSNWGYGAYAAETIHEGVTIGDYVGELENVGVDDDAVEVQAMIKAHLKLNYSFGIEGTDRMIDAKTAGNETRYLNHGRGADTNCEARQLMVYNTNHIVIDAIRRIKPGEELFLDYGERYWETD